MFKVYVDLHIYTLLWVMIQNFN